MFDLIRDSTIGQIINSVSNGRLLPYADQKADYVIPEGYQATSGSPSRTMTLTADSAAFDPEKNISVINAPEVATPSTALSVSNASVKTLPLETRAPGQKPSKDIDVSDARGGLEAGIGSVETLCPDMVKKKLQSEATLDPYLVDWDGPNDPDNPR